MSTPAEDPRQEHSAHAGTERGYDPAAEVVEICRDLIRMDTSNYGDQEGPGERKAAEHVAALLDEVGISSQLFESEPGRTSVVARWGGTEGDALLLHGHLDVVPAAATAPELELLEQLLDDGGGPSWSGTDSGMLLSDDLRHERR